MTGDQSDCLARIKALLPPWAGNAGSPVLDALLSGPAWVLAWLYSLYAYAAPQFRLATATDGFIDLIAADFLGAALVRGDDDDPTFRRKVQTAITGQKANVPGVTATLVALTGNTPVITAGSTFAVTIDINAGSVSHDEVTAAVEAVRPICSVVTINFL